KKTLTREVSLRIARGMTRDQVHELLGTRPGDYRAAEYDDPLDDPLFTLGVERWRGDAGTISVTYGPDGKVCEVTFHENWLYQVSGLDRARFWARRILGGW